MSVRICPHIVFNSADLTEFSVETGRRRSTVNQIYACAPAESVRGVKLPHQCRDGPKEHLCSRQQHSVIAAPPSRHRAASAASLQTRSVEEEAIIFKRVDASHSRIEGAALSGRMSRCFSPCVAFSALLSKDLSFKAC
eukprot:7163396-Pyramimonas_sp.AAC.1